MKLKDLQDFEYFRCHPAGRMLLKTGIVHEKKGHKCLVVVPGTQIVITAKTGARVPVPSKGEEVYYPPGLTVYRL